MTKNTIQVSGNKLTSSVNCCVALIRSWSVFIFQNARRASIAAEPLCSWVKANVQFSYVLEKIEPLEKEQNDLKK